MSWLGDVKSPNAARVLRAGNITLDLETRQLDVDGRVSVLTPKESGLLGLLMSRSGETLTRKQIMREVWETDYMGDTRTLDVHVHWLRKKLGDAGGVPKYLRTVRRVGYKFVDPNSLSEEEPAGDP